MYLLWGIGYLPLLHYFRLGKIISHERAAQIIEVYFTNVKEAAEHPAAEKPVRTSLQPGTDHAGIDQEIEEIKLVPFPNAIDLKQNRKYPAVRAAPLLSADRYLFINANLITDSTAKAHQ